MNSEFYIIKTKDILNNLINLSQIVFEVTDACNLNCRYCGYGVLYEGYDLRHRNHLSFNKVRNVLDFLTKLWKENIDLSLRQPLVLNFYGGEPLINIALIMEIIQYAESLKIKTKKLHYGMTTNGLLLNKNMDYFAKKEFNLLISLDGNENDHSYRVDHKGRNSHKQVVDNIKLLQQTYPFYFKNHVRFNTVLHNKNSAESAHNYIKDNFGKDTTISPLNNSGIRKDKVQEFLRMFQNVNNSIEKSDNKEKLESELFLEAPNIKQLTDFFYRYSGNMYDSYRYLFMDSNKMKFKPTGTCVPFYKKMFLTVNGKILQCEKINHEFALGHVSDNGVELDIEHIAEMANDYNYRFIKQCKTCAYMEKCSQCVFQVDELNNPKTVCHFYKSQKSYTKSLSRNLEYLCNNPSLYKKIMTEVQIRN